MSILAISASDQEIKLFDNIAIVSVIIEMTGIFHQHALDGRYRFLRIWKLVDNQLKIIAGSSIVLSLQE